MTMGTILRHLQPSVDFAKVIDRHYVRLVEPGSVLGLPAEPFPKDPSSAKFAWHQLQRHHPVDGGVIRAPHLAHAAAAQQLDQAITPERGALHRLTIRSQPRANQ